MSPADSPFAPLPTPSPHPATAELRAYAAGTLAPSEEHRIEAHTLECERCADLVYGFSMTDAAATNRAVGALRTRLQARTRAPGPGPAATRWAWPQLAAAAAVLSVVAGGIWTWEHHAVIIASRVHTATPPQIRSATRPEAVVPPPSSPPAVVTTPPEPPSAAQYASVAPAPSQPAAETQRLADRSRRAAAPQTRTTQAPALATASAMASSQAGAASVPPAASQMQQSLPRNEEAVRTKEALFDSAVAPDGAALASRTAKAQGLTPGNAATAHAAATPMPAALAINPSPVGGSVALRDYLRHEAADFEPELNAPRMSGTVRLQFVVGADGKLSNMKVTRGVRPDYDAEALRIVCDGPAWQPGIAGGRRASLPVELTVPF